DRPRPRPAGRPRGDRPVRWRAGQPGQGVRRRRRRPDRHRPPRLPRPAGRHRPRRRPPPPRLRLLAHPRRGGRDRPRRPLRRHRLRQSGGGVVNVLLLGGAGFIGLHLARRLIAAGHAVTVVDDFSRGRDDPDLAALPVHVIPGDLTDPAFLATLPHGWDQVYQLAAVVGVRNVAADPARVIRVNTLSVLHLLDWIKPGTRLFFASTSEVYAGGVDLGVVAVPTAEDTPAVIADVGAPRFAYAVSKLLGEAAVLHAAG